MSFPRFSSRRDLLRAGLLGSFGLGLETLLRARASGSEGSGPAARADACILVWLSGGPSHLDTLDPKPDAPADIRGEFRPISTSVPGVSLSEVLPRIAARLDRFTLIRSMTSPEAEHDRASHHMLTGYRPSPALVYPAHGSVVAKLRESSSTSSSSRPGTLPPYVAVPEAPPFASSGYLTPAFDPFAIGADPSQPGFRVRDLTPPDRLTLDRLRRRRGMVATLDRFAADLPSSPLTDSRDAFVGRAYDLLTSSAAQAAFRIDDETARTRDAYGRTSLGQSCLLARRLVEAGVSFITVNDRSAGPVGWDTHQQNFATIRDRLAPPLDQSVTALVADLDARGLLDRTLVVVMGEFGRTPKVNGGAGRDHHGRASSILLAGAGLPGGAVIGRTDATGSAPSERPVTPSDLAATLFTLLGIDPESKLLTTERQPIRLIDDGHPIAGLLG
jgi:hypothetical protein